MDTYSLLRAFADSWMLLALFGFFVSAVLWVFRPGSTKTYNEISQIPLRDDVQPPRTACTTCKNGGVCQSLKESLNV
jgi:cytochrome c oxidase cbb3-type subunit 4